MATKRKAPRIVWTRTDEWIKVAFRAKEVLAAGGSRYDALKAGQELLPPERRLSHSELVGRANPSNRALDHALTILAGMSDKAVAKVVGEGGGFAVPPYVPRANTKMPPADYSRGHGKMVLWTNEEKALLVRRVLNWEALGTNAQLARLFAEAQEIELPADRRRPRAALNVLPNKHLPKLIKAGLAAAHTIAHLGYDPHQRSYRKPRPVEAAKPAPAPQPPAAAREPAQEAPRPVAAPIPIQPAPQQVAAQAINPSPTPAASEAARVFGIGLANALVPMVEQMLSAHEQVVLTKVREEQRSYADQLARDMSQLLLTGLDRMLGGGSVLPEQQAVPENFMPAQPEVEPEPIKRVKIDVVGFEAGRDVMLVKHKLNGSADRIDLRFVGPDQQASYAPHRDRNVILLTQRIPHSLRDKIKASGCKPLYVKRTVGHVVEAITLLLRSSAQ